MGNCIKLGTLLLGSALIFGCASQNAGLVASNGAETYTHSPSSRHIVVENNPASAKMLVQKAKSAIGTPYVMGGSAPGGFDCSGLVQWTYNSLGVNLPRTAREQASVGHKVRDIKDMREGDIVAFRHPKRGYHTGIYVGDGKFVHSPRKRSRVRINSLSDPYFSSTLLGARRVDLTGSENLLASASGKLEQMVAEKSRLSLSARNLEKIKSVSKKSIVAKKAKAGAAKTRTVATHVDKKKSTIASNARKIQSVKKLTGKTGVNAKNGGAHAKLANASKKATAKPAARNAKKSADDHGKLASTSKKAASKTVAVNSKKNHKTETASNKKAAQQNRRRSHS